MSNPLGPSNKKGPPARPKRPANAAVVLEAIQAQIQINQEREQGGTFSVDSVLKEVDAMHTEHIKCGGACHCHEYEEASTTHLSEIGEEDEIETETEAEDDKKEPIKGADGQDMKVPEALHNVWKSLLDEDLERGSMKAHGIVHCALQGVTRVHGLMPTLKDPEAEKKYILDILTRYNWNDAPLIATMMLLFAVPASTKAMQDVIMFTKPAMDRDPETVFTYADLKAGKGVADLAARFAAAKQKAVNGKAGQVTVLGVHIVDGHAFEMEEVKGLPNGGKSFSFRHYFELVVSREGWQLYQAGSFNGVAFQIKAWMMYNGSRLRTWDEGKKWMKLFSRWIAAGNRGVWDQNVNDVFQALFLADIEKYTVYRKTQIQWVGKINRFEPFVRIFEVEDVTVDKITKFSFKDEEVNMPELPPIFQSTPAVMLAHIPAWGDASAFNAVTAAGPARVSDRERLRRAMAGIHSKSDAGPSEIKAPATNTEKDEVISSGQSKLEQPKQPVTGTEPEATVTNPETEQPKKKKKNKNKGAKKPTLAEQKKATIAEKKATKKADKKAKKAEKKAKNAQAEVKEPAADEMGGIFSAEEDTEHEHDDDLDADDVDDASDAPLPSAAESPELEPAVDKGKGKMEHYTEEAEPEMKLAPFDAEGYREGYRGDTRGVEAGVEEAAPTTGDAEHDLAVQSAIEALSTLADIKKNEEEGRSSKPEAATESGTQSTSADNPISTSPKASVPAAASLTPIEAKEKEKEPVKHAAVAGQNRPSGVKPVAAIKPVFHPSPKPVIPLPSAAASTPSKLMLEEKKQAGNEAVTNRPRVILSRPVVDKPAIPAQNLPTTATPASTPTKSKKEQEQRGHATPIEDRRSHEFRPQIPEFTHAPRAPAAMENTSSTNNYGRGRGARRPFGLGFGRGQAAGGMTRGRARAVNWRTHGPAVNRLVDTVRNVPPPVTPGQEKKKGGVSADIGRGRPRALPTSPLASRIYPADLVKSIMGPVTEPESPPTTPIVPSAIPAPLNIQKRGQDQVRRSTGVDGENDLLKRAQRQRYLQNQAASVNRTVYGSSSVTAAPEAAHTVAAMPSYMEVVNRKVGGSWEGHKSTEEATSPETANANVPAMERLTQTMIDKWDVNKSAGQASTTTATTKETVPLDVLNRPISQSKVGDQYMSAKEAGFKIKVNTDMARSPMSKAHAEGLARILLTDFTRLEDQEEKAQMKTQAPTQAPVQSQAPVPTQPLASTQQVQPHSIPQPQAQAPRTQVCGYTYPQTYGPTQPYPSTHAMPQSQPQVQAGIPAYAYPQTHPYTQDNSLGGNHAHGPAYTQPQKQTYAMLQFQSESEAQAYAQGRAYGYAYRQKYGAAEAQAAAYAARAQLHAIEQYEEAQRQARTQSHAYTDARTYAVAQAQTSYAQTQTQGLGDGYAYGHGQASTQASAQAQAHADIGTPIETEDEAEAKAEAKARRDACFFGKCHDASHPHSQPRIEAYAGTRPSTRQPAPQVWSNARTGAPVQSQPQAIPRTRVQDLIPPTSYPRAEPQGQDTTFKAIAETHRLRDLWPSEPDTYPQPGTTLQQPIGTQRGSQAPAPTVPFRPIPEWLASDAAGLKPTKTVDSYTIPSSTSTSNHTSNSAEDALNSIWTVEIEEFKRLTAMNGGRSGGQSGPVTGPTDKELEEFRGRFKTGLGGWCHFKWS